jgi:hypothetical protein
MRGAVVEGRTEHRHVYTLQATLIEHQGLSGERVGHAAGGRLISSVQL